MASRNPFEWHVHVTSNQGFPEAEPGIASLKSSLCHIATQKKPCLDANFWEVVWVGHLCRHVEEEVLVIIHLKKLAAKKPLIQQDVAPSGERDGAQVNTFTNGACHCRGSEQIPCTKLHRGSDRLTHAGAVSVGQNAAPLETSPPLDSQNNLCWILLGCSFIYPFPGRLV